MAQTAQKNDFSWPFWPALPIYPYRERRTICQEVVKDAIWTFDQIQGIFYVVVPIRMTVVKLEEGGLLVYAPVAPTGECVRLMRELEAKHGEVKYIILPTISGLEHKVFVGPFARFFKKAQVYVAPSQWSFPLNLPLTWLGFPRQRTHILPEDSSKTPFANQFNYAILGPVHLGPGRFAEVAFFDKRTDTLLVADSIVSIPENPPAIVQVNPYALLYHAKENAADIIEDTQESRRKGWQRICLFAMYFNPSVLDVPTWKEAWQDAGKAKDRSRQGYFGLYPFKWQRDWKRAFDALRGDGRLFVAPILQTLILNRAPKETIDWANLVAGWNFQRIIPCHFDAPINATPQQFRQAFSFLEKHPAISAGLFTTDTYPLPENEFKLLREIDQGLSKSGIVPASKEKV